MATYRSAVAVVLVLLVGASGVTAGFATGAVVASAGGHAASPPGGADGSNGNGSETGTESDEEEEDEGDEHGSTAEPNGVSPGPSTEAGATDGGPRSGPPSDGDDDRPGRGPPADGGNASAGPPAWADASGRANASVSNATAGTPARVNVSDARTAGVGVDALTVTTGTSGSYTLNVTTSDRSPADAPGFVDSPAGRNGSTSKVGHVRVTHSVSDTNISAVDFDFTVNATRLAAVNASPDDVALYRFHDGEWTELNTTVVGETTGGNRTLYAFEAHSPGLSDFVIGAKRAEFELADAVVSADRVAVGDSVTTRVRVRNTGGADGTFTVTLLLNDAVVDDRTVTIASDGTRQVSFRHPFAEVGTYSVRVNDLRAGEVVVLAAANRTASTTSTTAGTATETPEPTGSTPAATTTTAPGFGPAAAALSLVTAALLLRRRRG